MKKLLVILMFAIPAFGQSIIQTSAQLGMKCDGVTDDTQRFLNALNIGGGTSNVYLIFPNGTCIIKSINPINVPTTVTLDFTQAGVLSLGSGTTMTVNGPVVSVDNHQVFTGSGTYNVNNRTPVVQASAFGVVSDSSVFDATVTNTSNVVTCPNADCHFLTTAAVGNIIQGGTAANGIVLPITTISSVDSDNQVHTVLAATATPTAGTVSLAWGPDNTAALKAAWAASVQICQYLQLPAGVFFIKEALNSQNANCSNQNAGRVGGIIGAASSWINSKLIMRYDFLYASGGTSGSGCNGGNSTQACFFGMQFLDVIAVAIDGFWSNINPATSIILAENQGGYFTRVALSSLCPACSHVQGLLMSGAEPISILGSVVDVGVIMCNSTSTGGQMYLNPCLGQNGLEHGLFISSGSLFSKGNFFTGAQDEVNVNGGELHEENDYFTHNISPIVNSAQHWLKHCFFAANTITNNSGATLYIEDNDFSADTAHLVNNSGGVVFDQGGNIYPNSTFVTNSGAYYGPQLPPGRTAVASSNLVLSAGWGTTAAWSALSGAATFAGTITASGTGQSANPTRTVSFPGAFPVAPVTCYATQVGGTQAQGTFATSSLTNTGVVFTYSGTPGANNTVFVQAQCRN